MEGYTLEMPSGTSLVRLLRRNLQMLKSVSGMWELNGSSWEKGKQMKKRNGIIEQEVDKQNDRVCNQNIMGV